MTKRNLSIYQHYRVPWPIQTEINGRVGRSMPDPHGQVGCLETPTYMDDQNTRRFITYRRGHLSSLDGAYALPKPYLYLLSLPHSLHLSSFSLFPNTSVIHCPFTPLQLTAIHSFPFFCILSLLPFRHFHWIFYLKSNTGAGGER